MLSESILGESREVGIAVRSRRDDMRVLAVESVHHSGRESGGILRPLTTREPGVGEVVKMWMVSSAKSKRAPVCYDVASGSASTKLTRRSVGSRAALFKTKPPRLDTIQLVDETVPQCRRRDTNILATEGPWNAWILEAN